MTEFGKELSVRHTPIPGLVVFDLPVHGDSRGWFKENWQREKMTAVGLPDFGPVQNNVSFNDSVGTTRGIHAEPWDKWVSVASGKIFGAWVDLREGPTFGAVFSLELDPSVAVFVPRGVGNSYQTLEPDTAYTYLVNDHWSPQASYSFLNLGDETVAVPWPIPLSQAEVSEKDRNHPRLADVVPVPPKKTLVLGAAGQLGRALRHTLGSAGHLEYATRADLDVSDPDLASARRWRDYDVIINAAAYTAVDNAETADGRRDAWRANATGVANLAGIAAANGITLVHVSSDYVFDGSSTRPYREDDPVCPLGVYGQTKAAGDLAVSTVPRHYIIRTGWVFGDGTNFVATMRSLADRGVSPHVVGDQFGRPTSAGDLSEAIAHLLSTNAPAGVYNVTNAGDVVSWVDIARETFQAAGADPDRVQSTTAAEYASGKSLAPRPRNSALDLTKLGASGFTMPDWRESLRHYVTGDSA